MYVVFFIFDYWLFGWNIWFIRILCKIKNKHESKSWFIILCNVIEWQFENNIIEKLFIKGTCKISCILVA